MPKVPREDRAEATDVRVMQWQRQSNGAKETMEPFLHIFPCRLMRLLVPLALRINYS